LRAFENRVLRRIFGLVRGEVMRVEKVAVRRLIIY
jgi:hypothetical protein